MLREIYLRRKVNKNRISVVVVCCIHPDDCKEIWLYIMETRAQKLSFILFIGRITVKFPVKIESCWAHWFDCKSFESVPNWLAIMRIQLSNKWSHEPTKTGIGGYFNICISLKFRSNYTVNQRILNSLMSIRYFHLLTLPNAKVMTNAGFISVRKSQFNF